MGWNRGYTVMEKQVVGLYDLGVLTKDVLCGVMEAFRNTDIDHGGCYDLRSNDGMSADEIVVKVMEPERYAEIPCVCDFDDEKCGCNSGGSPCELTSSKKRLCDIGDLWYEITRREWEFW